MFFSEVEPSASESESEWLCSFVEFYTIQLKGHFYSVLQMAATVWKHSKNILAQQKVEDKAKV